MNADERMQLNEEVDLIYKGITKNAINHMNLEDTFNSFLERYGTDKTTLEKMIQDGDTNVLNVVEKMITDFLASKPSNFDEVTAARLGEKTLRDFNQKMKTKLDNTDAFQKVKLTDDVGLALSVTDVTELTGKSGFFRYIAGAKGMPPSSTEGVGFFVANNKTGVSVLAMDKTTKRLFLRLDTEWRALAFEGAYDDIKQEVNNVKVLILL